MSLVLESQLPVLGPLLQVIVNFYTSGSSSVASAVKNELTKFTF